MSGAPTPGPWTLKTHHQRGHDRMVPVWYLEAANGVGIARQPSYSNPEHEAGNAAIVGASLDMFEALTGVMDILGRAESNASGNPEWDHVGPRVAAARAAIAKATGK